MDTENLGGFSVPLELAATDLLHLARGSCEGPLCLRAIGEILTAFRCSKEVGSKPLLRQAGLGEREVLLLCAEQIESFATSSKLVSWNRSRLFEAVSSIILMIDESRLKLNDLAEVRAKADDLAIRFRL